MSYDVLPNAGCPRDFNKVLVLRDVPGVIAYIADDSSSEHRWSYAALFGLKVGQDKTISKHFIAPDVRYVEERLNDHWGWLASENDQHDWIDLSSQYRYWFVNFYDRPELCNFVDKQFKIITKVYEGNIRGDVL
jgi:hypothetical protein